MRAAHVWPAGRLSKAKQTELQARLRRVQEKNASLLERCDALTAFQAESRLQLDKIGRILFEDGGEGEDEDDKDDKNILINDLAGGPRDPPAPPSPPPPPPPAALLPVV